MTDNTENQNFTKSTENPKNLTEISENFGGADNLIITSPASQTLKECRKLYPKKLLSKRYRNHFITIPKTTLKQEEILESLKTLKQPNYIKVAKEHHKDGTTHYHIIIQCKDNQSIKQIHEQFEKLEGTVRGCINYQQIRNLAASIEYLEKEGESIEYGELKLRGKATKNNLIEIVKENPQQAIEYIEENHPMDMLKHRETILENINAYTKTPYEKFEIPDTSQATLRNWQQELFEELMKPPKSRRIFWVRGNYGAGKSFMLNYLADNYKYGVFCAGQCVSIDNLAYKYDEEGAIIWDLPRNFNWKELTEPLCNVVEKFSDFGQIIRSMKYKGKTQRVRGHVIVLSNEPCPPELRHRDIVQITATKKTDITIGELREYLQQNDIEVNHQNPQLGKYIKTDDTQITYYTEDQIKEEINKKKYNIGQTNKTSRL